MIILASIGFCIFSFFTAIFVGSGIASIRRAMLEGIPNPRVMVSVILGVLISIPNVFIASYIRDHGGVNLTLVIPAAIFVVVGLLIGLKNKNA